MEVTYEKDKFYIVCKFHQNGHLEDLDKRWSKAKKKWIVYDAALNRELLRALPANFSPEAKEALNNNPSFTMEGAVPVIQKTRPRPFQIKAIDKLLSVKMCALFAPTGSGKTKIMIDVIQSLYHAGKVEEIFIICPVSVMENWQQELDKHWYGEVPRHVLTITGIESYSAGGLFDRVKGTINDKTIVVVDESSRIKNPKAIRTDRLIQLATPAVYKYVMTGSPILNGTIDLFSQFKFLHIDIIGINTYIGFRNRYCIMGGYGGKKVVAYKKTHELMGKLHPYSYVIDKKEAMPDLPPQTFSPRIVKKSPEQARLIERIKEEMISESTDGEKKIKNALTKMLRIAQVAGGFTEDGIAVAGKNPKLEALKEIVDESPDEQIVIFVKHIAELNLLVSTLPEAEAIYGAVKPKARQEIIDRFQRGEIQYLVCQYQSGSIGLNMHAARICVYFSFDFSLEFWIQSMGRIARDGQERPMLYVPILMDGTVDRLVYRSLQNKQTVETAVRKALDSGTSLVY